MRGQDDHLRLGMVGLDLLEHVQPIGVRQLEIEQHERGRLCLEQPQAGGRVGRGLGMITVPT